MVALVVTGTQCTCTAAPGSSRDSNALSQDAIEKAGGFFAAFRKAKHQDLCFGGMLRGMQCSELQHPPTTLEDTPNTI